MEILEAQNVDLISPFPPNELQRMFGWMKACKALNETDYDPHTFEEFCQFMTQRLTLNRSWGIIDKNHLVNDRHPAPLIGVVIFERIAPTNGYFHVATTRRAWGKGLIDHAVKAVIDNLFTTDPYLLRMSACVLAKNNLVRGLAERVGFSYEGTMRNMTLQNGKPRSVVHYGLTKENWQWASHKQSESEEASSADCLVAETNPLPQT